MGVNDLEEIYQKIGGILDFLFSKHQFEYNITSENIFETWTIYFKRLFLWQSLVKPPNNPNQKQNSIIIMCVRESCVKEFGEGTKTNLSYLISNRTSPKCLSVEKETNSDKK